MKNTLYRMMRAVPAAFLLAAVLAPVPARPEAADGPDWKVRAELSYVNTSGNTDSQTVAGKLQARREGEVNRYFVKGSYLRTEDDGEEKSNRLSLDARYERVLRDRVFALLSTGYLRDRFSGYDYRFYAGPGLGVEILKTPRQRLKGTVSVLYNRDDFSSGDRSSDEYGTLKAGADYELTALDNLVFREELDWSASMEDTERYFVDSVTSVEVKVNGNVSVGMSYTVNYQNEPPSPELRNTDTKLLTTLIVDF